MAIAMGSFSFSIREYAARMRSVDYDRCWPFPGERAGRPPPPMPVRRFRWWVDELRASRSDGRRTGNLVDPVDKAAGVDVVAGAQDEQMPRSVYAVTAGGGAPSAEEKQMTRTPYRAKQRTPKKKSILELFAVAPPIHGGGKGRGEEPAVAKRSPRVGDGGDSVELMIRKTRGKEGGKRDKIGAKKKLKVSRKMMKKKNNLKVEISAAEKEKTVLFKRSSLDGFCKILKNEVYEIFRKMHEQLVHSRLKAATIRTIVQRRVIKLVQTSKNLEEGNLLPPHAKLKKRSVISSSKKKKEEENMRGDVLVDLVCEPSKYVISSGMDNTCLPDSTCLPVPLPHLQNLCKLVSDVLVESDREDSNEHPSMTKRAKLSLTAKKAKLSINDNRIVTSNLVTDQTDSEKQLSDSCGHITVTKASCKKRTTWADFDLNHPVQEHINSNNAILDELTMPPSPRYLDGQKVPSPRNNVEFDCDQRINQEQIFSFRSDHVNSSCISTGVSVSVSGATSALIFTRNDDKRHWMYCSDQRGMDLSERQTQLVDPMKDVSNGIVGLYGTPKQLVTSTCSSFQSKATVEPSPKMGLTSGDLSTVKDFVGLPLNSQGEFIQLHPGNRYDFCETDKMPNTELNSLQYLSSCSQPESSHLRTKSKFPLASFCHEDDQHCFLNHYYPASKVKTSDLDSAELQGQEKLKFQPHNSKAQVNVSDDRQRGFFCCGCKDYIATECFNTMKSYSERDLEVGIQSEIQPTMRLMGTNVMVGRYSKEHKGYNGEKIRTKKEITMSCRPTRLSDRAIPKRWQDEECNLKEDSGDSRDIPFELSSCFCTSADKLKSNHMHLDLGSNWMLEDWNSPSKPHGYNIDHSRSPVPCQSFLKKASYSLVHCIPETQFEEMGQQKASWASYPQNFSQHTLLSSAHDKHHQSVSHSIQSACHPYCTNQVPVQTSRVLSLQEILHWQQNTTSQYSPFMSCHPILAYQLCTVPQDNASPYASSYRNPGISYPSGSSSISQTYGSYAPALYSSSTSALRKDNFSSVSSTYGYNIKARDGTGINYAYDENHLYSKKCRKRPASENIKIMETAKRPNLKLSVEREHFHAKQEDNMRESEINSYSGSRKDTRVPVVALDKDTIVVSGGRPPLKSNHLRSGLIKLSAGAKHILRPNKSLNEENSSPIYMSVPFTQETSTGKGFITLEEAAEATKV